jgi:hypothetical protein
MKDSKLEVIDAFKFEKRLQTSIAVYLSIILLLLILILVKIEMAGELQQALIVILGLILIATLDAFKRALDKQSFAISSIGNQIIVRPGGLYVGGDYVGGDINNKAESRQTLAEAAIEIHTLLQQLEKFNPTATEAEKIAYVNHEATPALKNRVVNVAKTTGETEAVFELQQFLEQIEQYDTDNSEINLEQEKNKIENQSSPTYKSRMIAALKAGGDAAIEEALKASAFGVAQAIVKGWIESDNSNT